MIKLKHHIIAAARTEEDFLEAVESSCDYIFWLTPSIMTLESYIARCANSDKGAAKTVFVHIDMAEGVGKDSAGLEYLRYLGVDGIISTRGNLIKAAREYGLLTVQRFFIVDSRSISTAFDTIRSSKPDMVEIMPGLMPEVIHHFSQKLTIPVIAGGLIQTESDVENALCSGAAAISTSARDRWK